MPDDSRNSSTDILSTTDPCRKLANAIRRVLREGIELSPSVVEFIDSTYAYPSAEDLLTILNGESDTDRDTLLELIFAPDEHFQESLESLLTRNEFSFLDEPKVVGLLGTPTPETALVFPDTRGRISVALPEGIIETLVSQLHISRQLPNAIGATLVESFRQPLRNRVRVRFRNLRLNLTEAQIDGLCRYMSTADSQHSSFLPNLEFFAQFLIGLDTTSDIYGSLMAHKAACWSQLEQAMKQEAALAKSNMETLLMRGERILHFDKNQLRHTIIAIDDISLAVFGKTEALHPKESTVNLRDVQGREELDRLIKLFSGN